MLRLLWRRPAPFFKWLIFKALCIVTYRTPHPPTPVALLKKSRVDRRDYVTFSRRYIYHDYCQTVVDPCLSGVGLNRLLPADFSF